MMMAVASLAQLPRYVEDSNIFAPHSSLGMRSPVEYRWMIAERPEEVPV
jgi:transposase InsO family protein